MKLIGRHLILALFDNATFDKFLPIAHPKEVSVWLPIDLKEITSVRITSRLFLISVNLFDSV